MIETILASDTSALLHGEAIEAMRAWGDLSVDHVITDPPYSEKVHRAQRVGCTGVVEPTRPGAVKAQFNRARELGFDALTSDLRRATAEQIARVCKRWAMIFSDHEGSHGWREDLEAAGFEYVRTMVWIKKGCTPQFTGDRPATTHECIVLAHRRKPDGKNMKKRWNGGGKHGAYYTTIDDREVARILEPGEVESVTTEHGVYIYPIVLNRGAAKQRLHTTQKPLELMRALVQDFTDEGELIADPFAGSGTTLLAAQQLGRGWVGVELDRKYIDVIVTRLATASASGATP